MGVKFLKILFSRLTLLTGAPCEEKELLQDCVS